MSRLSALVLLSLAILPPAAIAAPAAATASAPSVSKQAHDDAFALVQQLVKPQLPVIGENITDGYMKALKQQHPDLSEDTYEAVRQRVLKTASDPALMKDMEEQLVPIFTNTYSDEELRQISTFARTSAGKKLLGTQWPPAAMNGALRGWITGTLAPKIAESTGDILQKAGVSPMH